MKKKALLIAFGMLALSTFVCGLAACGGDKRNAASPENDYMITYRSDWQGENDPDMQIDGSLDEARWQNKNWYTTCAPYGAVNESVWLKTTAFTTKYGLYIAAVLYDDNIVGDGEFNVTQGTCLEYHYTFRKQDGKLYNASYTDRGRFYLDVFGNYCTKGERMKRGVQVDGVVNSGETVSATFEVFVPWEQAGVEVTEDWYPEEAYVLPGCRVISEGQTYSLCTLGMVSERWRRDYQAMYYEFDENGYTKSDAADAELGDAKNGFAKSAGWNLDKLSEGEVSLNKTYEYDYIFFRNAFANNFEATMTIYPGEYLYDTDNGIVYDTNGLAMYRDGRSGFYLLTTTGQEFIPYLEYNTLVETAEDGVKAPATYHLRSLDNFVSAWHVSDDVCDIPNTEKAGAVEFSMIKYGADLFYFADGIYLGTQRVSLLNDSVYVGLYNCNRAATYKDYNFRSYTDEEVKDRLNESNIYPVNISAQSGGKVECDQTWVKAGETLMFKAVCDSGYLVDTIKIGDTDITEDCKQNVQRYGKYTVTVTNSADISVAFKELTESESSTISGMVYSGTDEKPSAATLKFASLTDASVVYSVRATSAKGYSVTLPDGKYSVFVTFGTKDAATQEITVNGDGTHDIRSTPLNVEVGNIKITDEGYYATEYSVTNTRCYIDTAENGQPFVMETTVKDMSDKTWPSVGFILSTGGNNWIKFVLRLACPGDVTDYYDTLIWHDVYDTAQTYYVRVVNFTDEALKTNPFTGEGGTAKIRLVYTGSVYYFYVNDTLIYSIDQDEAIQAGMSHTIASTLGEGEVSLGLFAERQITFTNWRVSKSYGEIWNLVGGTVIAEGFELTVNGNSVTDGKVLLGDEVTVSVAAQSNGTFMLDGNMIATEVIDGKSVAKFTVTGDHTVTYSVSYTVTGTVTGGDENTTVTIANEQGIAVYTGKTDASGNYTASLADGTYYVSAQSATQITNVETVTVNNGAATVGAIAFEKPIIDAWATGNEYAIDYKTGNYCSAAEQNQNGGWFAGIEVQTNDYYVLEATAKDMPTPADQYPSAGFMVGTQDNWLRFTVQWVKDNSTYRFVLWRSNGSVDVGQNVEGPFANGSMNVKLVYANGTYYFYVNGELVYKTNTESVGNNARVGLFNDWQITFTDWNYSSGRDAVASYLGKTLTVADGVEVKVNGAVVSGTTVNVLIGDEIVVLVAAQEDKTYNIVLDDSGIPTTQENGKAIASFTVTENHSVSYSVAYAVTGTVTGGNENTVVTIVGENGAVAYTGNANAEGGFTATLPNGTYYVSAQSATQITNVETVTVNNGAATVNAVAFEKPLITDWVTDYNHYTVDYKTGAYKTVEGQQFHGGWYAGNAAEQYVLTATVEGMTDTSNWSCVGFMVGTQESWLRFTVQYNVENGTYRFVLWRSNGDPVVGQNVATPFASGSMNLELVYANGTYYFYVNEVQIYTTSETVGNEIRVGLYNEYRLTFTDWNYEAGKDAVASYLGKTLTVADGAEVKVNGTVVSGTTVNVLVGDEITVSVSASTGESFNILVDGNGIETKQENGKAIASFTVTGNHLVSYSVAYAVTGTVTGGNENTTVTIANEQGTPVYTGKTDAEGGFTATLPNGTYYVSAQSATQVTNVETVTVNGSAVQLAQSLGFIKAALNAEVGNFAFDYLTGNYKTAHDVTNNRAYFATVASGTSFVLEATMKDMGTTESPSTGVILNKGDNHWVRIVVANMNGAFKLVIWRDLWNTTDYFGKVFDLASSPFTGENGTLNLKLIYHNGVYYVYLNGALTAQVSENDAFDNGNTIAGALGDGATLSLGVFAERDVTFTEWSYSSGRDAVADYLGKTLTVADGVEVKVNGAVVSGTTVNVLIGDEITVSVSASTGESFNILVDGNGIETKQENGKAIASFTVTENHSVSYSVAYAVTGTVTGGNENTTVTIANEQGTPVYTGKTDAEGGFTATLPNGTYYVSAQSATQITNVETVTVNNGAATVSAVAFEKPLITDWVTDYNHYTVDYKTGAYKTVEGQQFHGGWYASNAAEQYVLTATVEGMTDMSNWSCVGFMVGTEENWLRFTIQYNKDNGTYRFVLWRSGRDPIVGQNVETPFASGSMSLMLKHVGSAYIFYVNGVTVYTTNSESLETGNRVGLYNEYQITFTDWQYEALSVHAITGTVTNGNADTVVTVANDLCVVYSGNAATDGSFTINLPDGTYYVSAQSATQITNVAIVTVNGATVAANEIAFTKQLIGDSDWITGNRYTIDYKTGSYCSSDVNQNGGWFAGISNTSNWTLEATVSGMQTPANGSGLYPSVGFMVGTAENALRFTVQYASDGPFHRYVIWNQSNGVVAVQEGNFGILFTDGTDVKIKLVHDGEGYKFYVNETLVYTSTATFGDDARVGLFNEWQITFTDWKFTAE